MENKKEIKFLWKIVRLINKEHCKNKLVIDKIVLYKNYRRDSIGTYSNNEKKDKKIIEIYSKSDFLEKIDTLIHELAHAYKDQIRGIKSSKETFNFLKNKPLHRRTKDHIRNIISHDEEFHKINSLFLKTLNKHLKMGLK